MILFVLDNVSHLLTKQILLLVDLKFMIGDLVAALHLLQLYPYQLFVITYQVNLM